MNVLAEFWQEAMVWVAIGVIFYFFVLFCHSNFIHCASEVMKDLWEAV